MSSPGLWQDSTSGGAALCQLRKELKSEAKALLVSVDEARAHAWLARAAAKLCAIEIAIVMQLGLM